MSLKIEFHLSKSNEDEKQIFAKIKYNNEVAEFPIGYSTSELKFNATIQSEEVSTTLKEIRQIINAIYNQMASKETVTAEKIKNKYLQWIDPM